MSESRMYSYICETPEVLRNIICNRKEITEQFTAYAKDKDIQQIYVLGSGTSYHAGLSAKNYLEELLGMKVFCMYPTQFERSEKVFNKHTLVIGMSQGGQPVYGSWSGCRKEAGALHSGCFRKSVSSYL